MLRMFFLLKTLDLADVFCRQMILGIDPIDVFLAIGAPLCSERSTVIGGGGGGDAGTSRYRYR